jgi:hypothetical protein
MNLYYKVVIGFVDRIKESLCEMFETIVPCFEVRITVPLAGGGYNMETFQVPFDTYSEIQRVGGIGGKVRVTKTERRTLIEKEDFVLCKSCGDVLLYDEILQEYETCCRLARGTGNYLSGQCYIIDEYIKYLPNSVEFCINSKGRTYECLVSVDDPCYTFLRSFYENIRDNRFSCDFHFRGQVQGRKIILTTFEFDKFF